MPDENPSGAQGTTTTDPQAQAGAQGGSNGTGTGEGGGGGFNWELFPDVPEPQRPLLEPHLKQVQGHVTQLEQQYAPYKGVIDAGVQAETIQNLVAFDQQFSQDPVGTWLMLAENLQKQGTLNNDLDLEAVKAILNGEEPPEEGAQAAEGAQQGEEIPPWAQEIQQQLAQQREAEQTAQQQAQQQQRQRVLTQTMGQMRSQLIEAGYTEDQVSEDMLAASLIAHKGDPDKALAELTGLRESVLKGLANKDQRSESGQQDGQEGPTMPNGTPKSPQRTSRGGGAGWDEAKAGARQTLEAKMRAQAQGS